jgi:DNA replication protein DnaC
LAAAIAYRAMQIGFDVNFTTAAALIDDLSAAFREGQLAQALPAYTHRAALVVGAAGSLTHETDAANMLFHVVNERRRWRRAMTSTAKKSPAAWGRVLHEDDLAEAIIDRGLERGRLLRRDGPSVRTPHASLDEASKEESDTGDNVIRNSGNQRLEFPEPSRTVTCRRSYAKAAGGGDKR